MATPSKRVAQAADTSQHLERYGEHARRLQMWIGAYSAGLASLLIYQFRTATQEVSARIALEATDAAKAAAMVKAKLAEMQYAMELALKLIAAAILLQVVLLIVNKSTQFVLANRESNTWPYKCAEWTSDQFWVDVIADLGGVVLLIIATSEALHAIGIA